MTAFPDRGRKLASARPMRTFSLFALAGLAGAAAAAGSPAPAQAQLFGWWNAPTYYEEYYDVPRALRRGQVRRMLRSRGLRVVAPIRRNGRVYLVDVRTRRGDRRRLIVDRYRGDIVQSFPMRRRNTARRADPFGQSGPPRPPGRIANPGRGREPDSPVIVRPERSRPAPRVARRPVHEPERKPIISKPLAPVQKPDAREAAKPDAAKPDLIKPDQGKAPASTKAATPGGGATPKAEKNDRNSTPDQTAVTASASAEGVRGRAVPLPPAKPEGLRKKSPGKPAVARVKPDEKTRMPASLSPAGKPAKVSKPEAAPKKKTPVRSATRSKPAVKKETLRQMVPPPAAPAPVSVPVAKKKAPTYVKRYKRNKPRVVYPGPGADPAKGPPDKQPQAE